MFDASSDLDAAVYGVEERSASIAAILLHGRWESPAHMIDIAGRIGASGVSYVAPAAPGACWYPESFMAPVEANRVQLEAALARIDGLVQGLEGRGWPSNRIMLIGYSQGACLASEYVWRRPRRWGGLIAFTGGLIGPPGTTWSTEGDLAGTPVLLTDGDDDPYVPLQRVEETAAVFRAERANVEFQVYPGREHTVSDDECARAAGLIARAAAAA